MPRRLLVVLPSLEGGGAERFTVTLLRHIDRSVFTPHLALISASGVYLKDLPADVVLHDLGKTRVSRALFALVRLIWRVKPAIVFSTLGHMNLIIALLKPALPRSLRLVAREANLVSKNLESERHRTLFTFLYRRLYRRFDTVIAQTELQREDLADNFAVPREALTVIPNPVDVEAVGKAAASAAPPASSDTIRLLAVGRLNVQKGFDLLLKSLALLPANVVLEFAGKGEEEDALRGLAAELQVEDRITWHGFAANPYPLMASADLFVLPSRYEGFPNVLLEALAAGTPAVAFSGSSSAQELIVPGFNGTLADPEDHTSLARAIERAIILVNDATGFDRELLRKDMEKRFGVKEVVRRYQAAILGSPV